jgi:DNA-binding response OmpR family regulator
MASVLVVQHDRETADRVSTALRAAGHSVHQCIGPEAYSCPVLQGEGCDYVDEADVLVYGLGLQPIGLETDTVLLQLLRWVHPTAPLIVVDDRPAGAGQVAGLPIQDRFVQVIPTPCEPERVVSAVVEALARRPAVGAA